MKLIYSFLVFLFCSLQSSLLLALDNGVGVYGGNWSKNLVPSASPIMDRITNFYNFIFPVTVVIVVFVVLLMSFIIIRFRRSKNPNPAKFTHNTLVEIVWTAIPCLILLVIAIPSIKLLYFSDVIPQVDMTIKVTGKQWYWSYEYPDHGNVAFDSNIKDQKDLEEGDVRLLSVDNKLVLPVDTNIRVLITSADVIHSWAVPPLGVKKDAVPGRVNEIWINIKNPGTYYGQCSELCGQNHGFMPIEVKAVKKDEFEKWILEKGGKVEVKESSTAYPEAISKDINISDKEFGSKPNLNKEEKNIEDNKINNH